MFLFIFQTELKPSSKTRSGGKWGAPNWNGPSATWETDICAKSTPPVPYGPTRSKSSQTSGGPNFNPHRALVCAPQPHSSTFFPPEAGSPLLHLLAGHSQLRPINDRNWPPHFWPNVSAAALASECTPGFNVSHGSTTADHFGWGRMGGQP